MNRRQLRKNIFKLLFRIEFNSSDDMPLQCEMFYEEQEASEEDKGYIHNKYQKIIDNLDQIDELIKSSSDGWDIKRLGKVDLTILRLGIYEVKFDDEIPNSVAINEAVELAKEFGQKDSSAFVNAILAKLVK